MEEENGLTAGEVLRVILKRIWWVIGAAALCVIIVVLLTQLWYNKSKQYYSVSYEIMYPNSQSGKYPNGNAFIITDSISLEVLKDIKAGKYSAENTDEFKNVDIAKMLNDDDISISQNILKAEDNSVTTTYTLNVKAKYFSGEEQAVSFLRAVASYPVNRVHAIIAEREYWLNLTAYENAKTYEDKISALSAQKSYLQSSYTTLVSYDNKLDIKIAELRNLFTSAQHQALTDRLSSNFYVLDTEEYISNSEYRKSVLTKQIADNEKVIAALREERDRAQAAQGGTQTSAAVYAAALYDQSVIVNEYDNRIAALTAANAGYKNSIEDIDKTLEQIKKYTQQGTPEYAEKQEFDELLEKYCTELSEATADLSTATNELYTELTRIIFAGNKMEKAGGINAILAAVIGLLIGVVISGAVVCIIDLPKYKRAKLAAENSASGTNGAAGANEESAKGGDDGKEQPAPDEK